MDDFKRFYTKFRVLNYLETIFTGAFAIALLVWELYSHHIILQIGIVICFLDFILSARNVFRNKDDIRAYYCEKQLKKQLKKGEYDDTYFD